jgi:hypothetical protein
MIDDGELDDGDFLPLLHHLVAAGLSRVDAERTVAEVLAYFSETTEAFVRRRHRELQRRGLVNAESLSRIAAELPHRRVAPPQLSERQIRRVIYG